MRTLVESLKRMYETGKPRKVTKEDLLKRVEKNVITIEEYNYIVGETDEEEAEPTEEPEESDQ